ncbi:hypothetical protein C8R43DRAFT_1026763 [Mycena crocata]|nr:hypothetical protein C8R43DRAFT_1026763 [Mycena crocata]
MVLVLEPQLPHSRRDSMRRRRVLRLILVPALALLIFVVLLTLPQPQNLHIDVALDAVLDGLHLPRSESAQRIAAFQKSLASPKSPKSPRDFQVPEKYTSRIAEACASLRTKTILLVGPETTFYLHSLWLNALEIHEHRIHECPGPEFCSFHHICLPPDYATPTGRFKFPPKDTELAASDSSVLRYILSTSLHVSKDRNDTGYTQAVIDPTTGVRLKNACWIYQARKADVILVNRGPIPAPAWTFAGHSKFGNWSFAKQFPRHLVQLPGKSLVMDVVNAAFHVTVMRFLPEVQQSLRTLHEDPSIRPKLLAWHASWFAGSGELNIFDDDPWTLYYDAQGKIV